MYTSVKIVSLILIYIFLQCLVLQATDVKGGERVEITNSQTQDLYVGGGEISLDASIHGDMVVAGGEIYIRDSIILDLIAAGGEIYIQNYIGDDVRAAGGEIEISGMIYGDVVVAAGELKISKEAVIKGDLIIAGGDIKMHGTVQGRVLLKGGKADVFGVVKGPIEVVAGELVMNGKVGEEAILIANHIKLGESASFGGSVRYWHEGGEIDFGDALDGGIATFDPKLKDKISDVEWEILGKMWLLSWIIRVLGALLIIVLLMWAFPKVFAQTGEWVNQEFFSSAGWGLFYFLGLPIACAICIITFIGIPIGVFGIFFYAFSVLFSHILAAIVFTEAANYRYDRNWKKIQIVFIAWAVYIGIKILSWIPFVGWLIGILAALVAVGAMIYVITHNRNASLS